MGEKTDAENGIKTLCKEFAINIPPNYETTFARSICIYNVPPTIRAINAEAYTPRVISIGPIHNGSEELKEMEVQKLWYLQEFCNRPKSGKGKDKKRAPFEKDLKRLIEDNIDKIRHSYPASATSILDSIDEKLMGMILLDSIFILELFLRLEFEVKDDPILSTPWLKRAIQLDLVLLENQLPFFILDKLYKFAKQNLDEPFPDSYLDLTLKYFTDSKYVTKEVTKEKIMKEPPREIAHFTDFVRCCWCLGHPQNASGGDNSSSKNNSNNEVTKEVTKEKITEEPPGEIAHFTDFVRYCWCLGHPQKASGGDNSSSKNNSNNECSNCYSVTKLNQSGVKFRQSSTPHLLKVKFSDSARFREKLLPNCMKHVFSLVFEVPQLKIDEGTEILFRNLMALEQCRYPKESYICDYVMLLDSLIDTAEDVDHLTDKKIILNKLGDDIAVKTMVNRLGLGIVQGNSSFGPICNRLTKYHDSNWNKDIAFFKSVYFKNVWIGTGTVVGVIVLLLTTANTIRLFATTNHN